MYFMRFEDNLGNYTSTDMGFADQIVEPVSSNFIELKVPPILEPGAFYTLETSATMESGSWSDVSTFRAEDSTKTVLAKRDKDLNKQFWRVRRNDDE